MISLRSLLKNLQGLPGTTRNLPLLLGRYRLLSDWSYPESLRNMPFLKGPRLLPSLLALRWIGLFVSILGFAGLMFVRDVNVVWILI
ncbi:hypothetical protein OIU74_019133 [Salix koriyanagi]|uniref:Uncharacterized protein n=1 Tax=Salix koriyanagi TaxID=2511006 RepID=A0A9Q0WTU0_9ROSI|nr:hypothetical protein OIU74_019133 [Salix koriyanagi]